MSLLPGLGVDARAGLRHVAICFCGHRYTVGDPPSSHRLPRDSVSVSCPFAFDCVRDCGVDVINHSRKSGRIVAGANAELYQSRMPSSMR